jgi:hypothetical protein
MAEPKLRFFLLTFKRGGGETIHVEKSNPDDEAANIQALPEEIFKVTELSETEVILLTQTQGQNHFYTRCGHWQDFKKELAEL